METIAIILFGGACFALGVYVSSQISEWIECKVQKKLKENEESKKS